MVRPRPRLFGDSGAQDKHKPRYNYVNITRTMMVPNVLVTTLDAAARETSMGSMPARPNQRFATIIQAQSMADIRSMKIANAKAMRSVSLAHKENSQPNGAGSFNNDDGRRTPTPPPYAINNNSKMYTTGLLANKKDFAYEFDNLGRQNVPNVAVENLSLGYKEDFQPSSLSPKYRALSSNGDARRTSTPPSPAGNSNSMKFVNGSSNSDIDLCDSFNNLSLPSVPEKPKYRIAWLSVFGKLMMFKLPLREGEEEVKKDLELTQKWWPKHDMLKPKPFACCCRRPARTIFCRFCGFHMKGNVKYHCPQHPQQSFLNDFTVCPGCKAPNLLLEVDWNQ